MAVSIEVYNDVFFIVKENLLSTKKYLMNIKYYDYLNDYLLYYFFEILDLL